MRIEHQTGVSMQQAMPGSENTHRRSVFDTPISECGRAIWKRNTVPSWFSEEVRAGRAFFPLALSSR
jgi:hypothetical protein